MVVMVDALNSAMSVGVGTVSDSQLVPVFQSLVPGANFHTGAAAALAVMMRKASCGP